MCGVSCSHASFQCHRSQPAIQLAVPASSVHIRVFCLEQCEAHCSVLLLTFGDVWDSGALLAVDMLDTRAFALVFGAIIASVSAHAICTQPRQRGAFRVNSSIALVDSIDLSAPYDQQSHYPAGDKSFALGAGMRSQIAASGGNYTPFNPFSRSFVWRAGICGDAVGGGDHKKGGKYYGGGRLAETYAAGSVVDFATTVLFHHNGFVEFFVCNMDACKDDDISPRCFQDGYCRRLLRAKNKSCDSGNSKQCGPIDRNNPGRWYLPCKKEKVDTFGGGQGTMKYQIPNDLTCTHCVVLWYYVSSTTCNVSGVREYFEGPDKPNWGNCPGQNGAIGGFRAKNPTCGGKLFAEEYLQCADIAVYGSSGKLAATSDKAPAFAPPKAPNPAPSVIQAEAFKSNRACRCLEVGKNCWPALQQQTGGVCKSGKQAYTQSLDCMSLCCKFCRAGGGGSECNSFNVKSICGLR